jgi:glutamate racemase
VAVIDPAPAVARQTARVLSQSGLRADRSHASRHTFYTSGEAAAFAAMIERLFPLLGKDAEVRAVRWRTGRLETST